MAFEDETLSPKGLDELEQLRDILYGQQYKALLDQIQTLQKRLESLEAGFQRKLDQQEEFSNRTQRDMDQRLSALEQSLESAHLETKNQISKVAAELSRGLRGLQSDLEGQLKKHSADEDELRRVGEQVLREEIEQRIAAVEARLGEFKPQVVEKLADIERQMAAQEASNKDSLAVQVQKLRSEFEAQLSEQVRLQETILAAQTEMESRTSQQLAELAEFLGRLEAREADTTQRTDQRLQELVEHFSRLETATQDMDERLSQRMFELFEATQKRIDETSADQAAAHLAWRIQNQESGESMHRGLLDLVEALERRKISRQELGKALADLSQALLGE